MERMGSDDDASSDDATTAANHFSVQWLVFGRFFRELHNSV
jgi:hypothetical protein